MCILIIQEVKTMKKFKRIIASLLCVTLVSVLAAAPVFALTFPDVENDASVSWAKSAINSMTDKGYIKGYEDGTYKPQQAISKIEALLLMSRIMGVDEQDYEMSVDWANAEYEATVTAINSQYPDELCYLMYLNVLNLTDLRNYASSANANTSLLRWQAAYLMVKLTGRDKDAQGLEIKDTSIYSDFDKIPAEAQKYVVYANNASLMNGMGKDDNGKDYFSPDTTLTRAQMAVLLDRVITLLARTATLGTVENIDYKTGAITVATTDGRSEGCETDDNSVIKFEGKDAAIDDIEIGDEIMVTFTSDSPRLVEAIAGTGASTSTTTKVYGVISNLSSANGRQQIVIRDAEDDSKTATYTAAANCAYTVKGTKAGFNDLKVGNNVELVLTGDQVTSVTVNEKETTASGLFSGINSKDNSGSYIVLYDENGGNNTTEYALSTGNIKVTRNGETSNIRDLAKNDRIKLTMTNGKVTAITATSETSEYVGTIEEIVLSSKPEITINIDGSLRTYSLSTATKVKVNNADGTIYDLRPGNSASIVADGNVLASIEASSTGSYGKTSISGKVESINTTLKVITIQNQSGGTDTVYYESGTTFLNSNGKSSSVKDVKAGSNINVTGSDSTGYFVATIVIVD